MASPLSINSARLANEAAPDSPLSMSSNLSGSPPLTLDPRTQALLDSFWTEEADRKRQLEELTQNALGIVDVEEGGAGLAEDKEMLDVDTFRALFQEDWQISQFWYSTAFATKLSTFLHSQVSEDSTVAFLCCPTGFVGFQHMKPLPNTRLLEYDSRFEVFAGKKFVKYDLDEPDKVPEDLKGKVDLAIVDPPFLNEITNRKLSQSLLHLLHPTRGKLVIITSTSVSSLSTIYNDPPLGPLHLREDLPIQHANNLANDFAMWTSWRD